MPASLLLLPAPQRIDFQNGIHLLEDGQTISLLAGQESPESILPAAQRLLAWVRSQPGLLWTIEPAGNGQAFQTSILLEVDPSRVSENQGYLLEIAPEKILILGHDPQGAFYGVCTLLQIISQYGRELPCLNIHDWPDFPARGVMLDISRDKVPTMETLYGLVDLLAGWKINQLQLYTEHTFAYTNHREVWENASPLTAEEIQSLDGYCRERFVELVPNQNSFGHMTRWLKHPRYTGLAELTGEFMTPWGIEQGPFSLCPGDPGSLDLIGSMLDELLPNFTSQLINVGLDETHDVGQGRSQDIVSRIGAGRVYLDFLLQIYQLVKARGHIMQFWGDIIVNHPQFISELPRDMIALEWGYEFDHPFDQHGALFAAAGIPFYVCPGTSSWASLGGRTDNAIGNLRNAAVNGRKHGAIGYLITDWGDGGHWQPLSASYLGFAAGAAFSWGYEANQKIDLPDGLSRFAFHDPSGITGKVAYDLGNIYKIFGLNWVNASILFGTLQRSFEHIRQIKKVNPEGYQRTLESIDEVMRPMPENCMASPEGDLVERELNLIAWLMRHACRRGLLALETEPLQVALLASELDQDLQALISEFQAVWLSRNRPGGLVDSVARFEKAGLDYRVHAS